MNGIAQGSPFGYVLAAAPAKSEERLLVAVRSAVLPQCRLGKVRCASRLKDSEPGSEQNVKEYGLLLASATPDAAAVDFGLVVELIPPTSSSSQIPHTFEAHGLWWVPTSD
ncbi:uncharacterized protein MEPE_05108 [Melanopsichium pennsylvanicum]|uniref:Uncharacterized protein n=2 Tax=Melanopsichium pennsylvanicum TaxID=63383 RepID=A0AAJ5C7D5_9BASI|nr:uncharacterized protein BN887_04915 [Melanopsichium pennsylvanicum 4]SNX86399.1 uncharacterized protein MEPE_05108 [Melanopsichium pennsylvanicum]